MHPVIRLCLPLLLALTTASGAAELKRMSLDVDGTERTALLYVPETAATSALPVVFAFHGHGGSAQNAARMFSLHTAWPEAIAVYPQGLNTPGRLTDPEGKKPGWQHSAGVQDDRDLKFFDALLERLKKTSHVATNRIYATGHSNGGGFTYLLWETRPDTFAALAPSGAATRNAAKLKPKPVLHIAGDNDPLVKYEWQKATIDIVRRGNGCAEQGEAWAPGCLFYPSKSGTPLVTYIQSGGHKYPADAPDLIVRFFRQFPAATP